MNEAKPKKKRSLWWIWLILLLVAFAGGAVFGLKLSTMPGPSVIRDSLLERMGAAVPALTDTPAEPESAEPDPFAEPAETPAPAEEAAPAEETAAPLELSLSAENDSAPEKSAPAEPMPTLAPNAAPAYLGLEAAAEKALAYAKVDEADAVVTGNTRTRDDDGKAVYVVEFHDAEQSYSYTLDAVSGELEGYKITALTTPDAAEPAGTEAEESPAE